jgi:SAM-dependent methyltransferase
VTAALTGAEYVAEMARDPLDREYRRAFLELALALVPSRGSVFDFGSGPGLDARIYARAGLRVSAFDTDPSMCEYFSRHCAKEIAAGAVQLRAGTYADFLDTAAVHAAGFDLIVANFAPLNLVAEPRELFARFFTMAHSEGRLLVSVLNPFFRGLLFSRQWWRGLARLFIQGRYTAMAHENTPVTRWRPARLAQQAASYFDLEAVHVPMAANPGHAPRRFSKVSPIDWKCLLATQFLFMQFRRRARA